MTDIKRGDNVSWNSSGGAAHGKVQKKLTDETVIKGHKVKASASNPEYLVKSDNGGVAAHKPDALNKE